MTNLEKEKLETKDNIEKTETTPNHYREKENEILNEVLYIKMVSHGASGGRKVGFQSTVIVGDQKERVGFYTSKANSVRQSIDKAIFAGKKRMQYFSYGNSATIPFEVLGKYHTTKVILKPVKEGHGLIAGFVVRSVLRMLGIRNICCKVHGSRHRRSVALATFDALEKIEKYKGVFDERQRTKNETLQSNKSKKI